MVSTCPTFAGPLPSLSDEVCRQYRETVEQLNRVCGLVEARMEKMDSLWRNLKPTVTENCTEAEAAVIHKCKLQIMALEPLVFGNPKERLALKRQLRFAGAPHDPRAPLCDLRALANASLA
jgi:hypothetical protein